MVTKNKQQIEMDFLPGLTDQYPDIMDLASVVIYGSRTGLGGVAAYLDKSPSLLSRMLNKNPEEQRHLPLSDLPKIVEATGDLRLVYWLVEKFCEDSDSKRKRLMAELSAALPQFLQLVKEASK